MSRYLVIELKTGWYRTVEASSPKAAYRYFASAGSFSGRSQIIVAQARGSHIFG
jgi:hypothetical protein